MLKPPWLNKKINFSYIRELQKTLRSLKLKTVCEEALCPNIGECFKNGVATFLILGNICTRNCKFCGLNKGIPSELILDDPKRVKRAVEILNLNYVVITSPTRDDLFDGGVEVFCQTVKEIKNISLNKKVEILIPDFGGNRAFLEKISNCGAEVIAHNLETVPSLYIKVRENFNYQRSLEVLRLIKFFNKNVFTKSGLILGLGEKIKEILEVLRDLRSVDCDFLTIGQYLPPSLNHHPLREYIPLETFSYLKKEAYRLGFLKVESSPYIRSSYLAHRFLI